MWCFYLLCVFLATVSTGTCQCEIPKHHTEIGCQPVHDDDPECPTRFDCDHLTTRNSSKCHYKGISYDLGEQVYAEDICLDACTCTDYGFDYGVNWHCPSVDCSLGTTIAGYECYKQHSFDRCCGENFCYAPDEELPVVQCEYNNVTYLHGQHIETGVPCVKCICEPEFDGTLDGPGCTTTYDRHSIELHGSTLISAGCAPIYYDISPQCLYTYICPVGGEYVVTPDNSTESDYKCTFGDLTFNVGEKLFTWAISECAECTCSTPTLLTCLWNTECGTL
ncbi:hypothetical protein L9F63_021133 [Diploptera punctata]|uniref:VWFC domain-containing protein n=1 Tax=Diploptera punctata TaxID=6984 RepID=A0AAD7ZPX3_DIPPU|nr:hypothetical protein L9F63_021133 [Diploptera punctata]